MERVHILGVVLWQVSRHLYGSPHDEVEGELSHEGGVHIVLVLAPRVELRLEYARSVVHRSTLQARERQYDGVVWAASTERLILRATRALVANPVWPRARYSGGSCGLVGIDHDVVLRRLGDTAQVVVVHLLREMVVATRYDVAHIATLHGIIAILVHEIVGILHVTLIVDHARRSLVVHHELHALAVGVLVERLDVEVGIRGKEVEHIVFHVSRPVFPSFVPSLDEHLREAIGGGEVDIPAHLLIGCPMLAVGLRLGIVGDAELHRRIIIGVSPRLAAYYHLPPHAAILRRVNPRRVFYLARLVEIVNQVVGLAEHVARVVADGHRAPWRVARSLHVSLVACGIWCEPALEDHVLVVEVEVHRGVVDASCLVYVDVEPILCLHLQCRLHSRGREHGHGRVFPVDGIVQLCANLRQLALCRLLLLGVVVARQPPRGVVARHGKLRMLFLDDEIDQVFLCRELIAEPHANIVDTEADGHLPV